MVAFKIASRSFVIVMYIDGVVGVVELTESSECDLSQEADSFCFAKKGFVANNAIYLRKQTVFVLPRRGLLQTNRTNLRHFSF
jgi:hypothetical protein